MKLEDFKEVLEMVKVDVQVLIDGLQEGIEGKILSTQLPSPVKKKRNRRTKKEIEAGKQNPPMRTLDPKDLPDGDKGNTFYGNTNREKATED
jgi:hypothetical protein